MVQQQNYGRDGMALLLAAVADGIPGGLVAMAGLGLLFTTVGGSVIAEYLIWIGVSMLLVGFARTLQGARAARIHRDGRPFIRAQDR